MQLDLHDELEGHRFAMDDLAHSRCLVFGGCSAVASLLASLVGIEDAGYNACYNLDQEDLIAVELAP